MSSLVRAASLGVTCPAVNKTKAKGHEGSEQRARWEESRFFCWCFQDTRQLVCQERMLWAGKLVMMAAALDPDSVSQSWTSSGWSLFNIVLVSCIATGYGVRSKTEREGRQHKMGKNPQRKGRQQDPHVYQPGILGGLAGMAGVPSVLRFGCGSGGRGSFTTSSPFWFLSR